MQSTKGLSKLRPRPDVKFSSDARSIQETAPHRDSRHTRPSASIGTTPALQARQERQAAERNQTGSGVGATRHESRTSDSTSAAQSFATTSLLASMYIPPGSPAVERPVDHHDTSMPEPLRRQLPSEIALPKGASWRNMRCE